MKNQLRRVWQKAALAALAGLCLTLPGTASALTAYGPHTSYSGSNYSSEVDRLTYVKPQWSLPADALGNDYTMADSGAVAAGDGNVFFLQKGQLLAVNAQTGKRLWKYGAGLQWPLQYRNGKVYVSSKNGMIYAVDGSKGRRLWASSKPAAKTGKLLIDGDKLFAAADGGIRAYRLQDGKSLWEATVKDGYLPAESMIAAEGLVLAEGSVSGAYTYGVLYAFDQATGRRLWEADNHALPAAVKDGTVISQRTGNLLDMQVLTTLDWLDARTGKTEKTVVYNPENVDPDHPAAKDGVIRSGGMAWYSGDRIYLDGGDRVYSYPADADPAKTVRDTYLSGASGTHYIAGPFDGRMLFTDANNLNLYGVKTANKTAVGYNAGLRYAIARLDLIGHGLYIIQTDGKLIAVNLQTAQPVVGLVTGGNVFGPTLAENGMIIVQSKGKVQAFKEPQTLKAARPN
ncbi:PQQ-binding-like beta-propeller repeat protein [Paenibacillus glufosinatiresistens]|uniref:PQQ-binding-like beta-propeller repeat protein n=1 Tax=Paenibacillus glufosinatiresistens TaxID=3070657 RepID=UPI00286DA670|nr:PQQ-binding-like beta-propeller repeat protein [Paenibacillus sp. YX.27]